jgi:hypothetical protein
MEEEIDADFVADLEGVMDDVYDLECEMDDVYDFVGVAEPGEGVAESVLENERALQITALVSVILYVTVPEQG